MSNQGAEKGADDAKGEPTYIPPYSCENLDYQATAFWTDKAWELSSAELTTIRESAGKWMAAIASLTGITAIVTVLAAYKEINELERYWKIGAVVLLILSLILAVFAIMKAVRAEIGPLEKILGTAENVCAYLKSEPDHAASAIKDSRKAALGSLIALVIAILVIGAGPKDDAQRFIAIPATGAAGCGLLETMEDGSVSLISETDGAPAIPVVAGVELLDVDSCEKNGD